MSNDLFKAFMVGSQIGQIRQQARTNQQLNALHAHQLDQAAFQERLNWIREQVFAARQNFEMAAAELENYPARAFYLCESNFRFLDREAISTKSFPDLADKEYFRQIWHYGEQVRDQAQSVLPDEVITQAHHAAIGQVILPQLRNLCAWTEIAELLPGGLLKNRYSDWQKPLTRWVLVLFFGLVFFPLLIWPLYLWATDPYPKVLPRIRQLAQSVGGWVQDYVTRKEALQIAGQSRAILESWGLTLPAHAQGLKSRVASAEEMVANFTANHLQLA